IAQDLLPILEGREVRRRGWVEVPFDERIARQHQRPGDEDGEPDGRHPTLGTLLVPGLGLDPCGYAAKDDRRRQAKRDHASNEYDDTYRVHHLHVSLFDCGSAAETGLKKFPKILPS